MSYDPLALAAMVARCGWDPTVVVTNQQIALDGNGTDTMFLPSLFVTAVSAISVTDSYGNVNTYSSTPVTNPDSSITPASIGPGLSIGWSDNGVLTNNDLCAGGIWTVGEQNVVVTYSGGYATVPPDLDAALNSIGKRTASMSSGVTEKSMGLARFVYSKNVATGDLLVIEQLVLDKFRLPKAR